jgi:hypothetical protein
MVNIGRGVEDVEDSLPRPHDLKGIRTWKRKQYSSWRTTIPAEAERKRLLKGTTNLKDPAERANYE